MWRWLKVGSLLFGQQVCCLPRFRFSSAIPSCADVHLEGCRGAGSFGVASMDCPCPQSCAPVAHFHPCSGDIGRVKYGNVSVPRVCGVAAAPSVSASGTPIRSSAKIILHRQVTVADLGLVSSSARPAVGHIEVGSFPDEVGAGFSGGGLTFGRCPPENAQ